MTDGVSSCDVVPSYDVDIYDDMAITEQNAHFRAMRDLGPVVWLPRHGNFAITRYAELSEALKNWKVFSSASGVAADDFGCTFSAGNTLASDPPLHDEYRKISAAPLMPKALGARKRAIQDEADELIEALVSRETFDGIKDFAQHLPLTMVTEFVGLPEDGRANMLKWAAATFDILGCQNARGRAAVTTVKEMRDWIDTKVEPKSLKPGSWAKALYELAGTDQIPPDYFPIIMRDYLGPSLDTTISATGQLIYQLGTNPDQWQKLRNDPSLIPAAVHEAVRLASPIRSFTRRVTRDCELGGVTLPEGARVMMLYASANRDERQFPEPDRFDLTRENSSHLGFGIGVHMCEGMHLAQMEMQSLLRAMVSRVETIQVGVPTLAFNNTIHGFAELPVTFTPSSANKKIGQNADMNNGWLNVRVVERAEAATGVVSLVLEAQDGGKLPEFEAGSHIDVKLPSGLIRQYSLCSPPHDDRYRLGVLRDANSRGGSEQIHADLHQGSPLQISAPRNLFPLDVNAPRSLLLAGGIGITPILAMGYTLQESKRDFSLHYTVRETSRAAFVAEMTEAFGDKLHLYADAEQGAPRLSVAKLLAETDVETHIYCCGPGGFIDHVLEEALKAGWEEQKVHFERFSAESVDKSGSFRVTAKKSGLDVDVPDGKSILDVLLDAGLDVPFSCESGVCGTCLCDVLEGTPDHQDAFQTTLEKESNKRIAICCSRSKSGRLVLDI